MAPSAQSQGCGSCGLVLCNPVPSPLPLSGLFPDPSCGDLLGMSQKDLFSKDELSAIWRTNVFQSGHGKSEALKMYHNIFLNSCQRKGL